MSIGFRQIPCPLTPVPASPRRAVYCLNMVGDAPRDLLDPRLRGGGGSLGGGVGRAPPSAPARRCRR